MWRMRTGGRVRDSRITDPSRGLLAWSGRTPRFAGKGRKTAFPTLGQRIYGAIQLKLADGFEFNWDSENTKHLAAHRVTPAEFEQMMRHDPVDLDSGVIDGEERYRSIGITNGGRLLLVVYTFRKGKIRPVTAFPAGVSDTKAFLERSR